MTIFWTCVAVVVFGALYLALRLVRGSHEEIEGWDSEPWA